MSKKPSFDQYILRHSGYEATHKDFDKASDVLANSIAASMLKKSAKKFDLDLIHRTAQSVKQMQEFKEISADPVKICCCLADPKTVEITSPYNTLSHSLPFIADKLLVKATADPDNPATKACDSLVGIPKSHAITAQSTIATNAAHCAINEFCALFPKFTILKIVCATLALINDITKTPKKLQISASINALLGLILLVEIAVAIVLGASVQPFTIITAEIKMVINKKL